MELKCSMYGCDNSLNDSTASSIVFYKFPTDINLCKLWVQNCNRAEYLNDFDYSGASAFTHRSVCSEHFTVKDFINANNLFEGIKLDALPVAQKSDTNCEASVPAEVVIKNEPIVSDCRPEQFEDFAEEEENKYSIDESTVKNFLFETHEELNYSEHFTWFNILNSKELVCRHKSYETKEEYNRRKDALRAARKRANETPEQRKERLYKNAVRIALRRNLQSEEEKQVTRMNNALRAAYRRMTETSEQRKERKRKEAARAAQRRKLETENQRAHRKEIQKIRAAKRRSEETPEQRASRLKADRERAKKRRLLCKLQENTDVLHGNEDNNSNNLRNSVSINNINGNDIEQQAHDKNNDHFEFIPIKEIKSEITW